MEDEIYISNTCKKLIEESNYEECEKLLCNEMAKYPHSPIPHNILGILLEQTNNHVLAMKHFRAAYSLDPSYAPARYNLGISGEEMGPISRQKWGKQMRYRWI